MLGLSIARYGSQGRTRCLWPATNVIAIIAMPCGSPPQKTLRVEDWLL